MDETHTDATGQTPAITHTPMRLAVLVSGGGSTLANLHRHIEQGKLNATIVSVIASNPKPVDKIKAMGLPYDVQLIERKQYDSTAAFSQAVFKHIDAAAADIVALAGFLSLLNIPEAYHLRIVNIHPALLPAFGGKGMFGHHVHEAVLAHGCKVSGCTVHFADATYDTGPILVQRTCPACNSDSPDDLAARVFEQECIAYPEALQLLAEKRVRVVGRCVHIVDG